jgi:hypothetical protein
MVLVIGCVIVIYCVQYIAYYLLIDERFDVAVKRESTFTNEVTSAC